jgi:hypothetical protein
MLHTEWQAIPAASSVMRRKGAGCWDNMERQVEKCSDKVGASDAIDMKLGEMMGRQESYVAAKFRRDSMPR